MYLYITYSYFSYFLYTLVLYKQDRIVITYYYHCQGPFGDFESGISCHRRPCGILCSVRVLCSCARLQLRYYII